MKRITLCLCDIISCQIFCTLFFLVGCTSVQDSNCDRLNDRSYVCHYQSLDSVKVYADSVLNTPGISSDARAEALNNLAFYHIGKMQYSTADSILREIYSQTDNQIELCISNIQHMRLCQRQSHNKNYYEYRQKAINCFNRLHEESGYSSRQQKRINYAESEFRLVSSVYDYYVGKTEDAIYTLMQLDSLDILRQDTAQYLAYLYNIGSGGIITHGTKESIAHQEYDYLLQCYLLAGENSYVYWQANALQAIAEHILDDNGEFFRENPSTMHYVNVDNVPDTILAGNLAERSVSLFDKYGDVYQRAASWRTLSQCYARLQDYHGSLYSLNQSVKTDTAVYQAPALMASLYELFSLSFSAINQKQASDYYRNKYLDMYEDTRQDRQLEARAEQLDHRVSQLNLLIYVIIGLALLLLGVLLFLVYKRYKQRKIGETGFLRSTNRIIKERQAKISQIEDEREELEEQVAMKKLQLSRQEETYIEQRAKMHLINTITPFLDRMLHETTSLAKKDEDVDICKERLSYIKELIGRINEDNSFLTRWIQMKQGELSLHIETFPIQTILDILSGNISSYTRQGITLDVIKSDVSVKADRTLTLFMLNTLCDNARKFTPEGGSISVSAQEVDHGMVEICVEDTGCGMSAEQCFHIFDVKPIIDEQVSTENAKEQRSHGFGLLNCKGIIEKYKKTNSLFSHCTIGVESKEGVGTRFFFRLPQGIQKTVLAVMLMVGCISSMSASALNVSQNSVQNEIQAFADSVYNCNVAARYSDAIMYAERCMNSLNRSYLAKSKTSKDTLLLNDPFSNIPAEIRWMRDSVAAPYEIILSVRNEIAVAALALNDWELYKYNNSAYSQLFKESSIDNSLADYCLQMESSKINSNVAVCLLVLLLLSFVPIYYFAYYRHILLDFRKKVSELNAQISEGEKENAEISHELSRLSFEHDRLHVTNNVISNSFSAIKHETMYYPSRIVQLIKEAENNDVIIDADYKQIDELAHYYRAVYDVLAEQAQYNSRSQLPIEVLHDNLLRVIAKLSGKRKSDVCPDEVDNPYHIFNFVLRNPSQTVRSAESDNDVLIRILTQIVRDLGELYNLRRCGVIQNENSIKVIAPAI